MEKSTRFDAKVEEEGKTQANWRQAETQKEGGQAAQEEIRFGLSPVKDFFLNSLLSRNTDDLIDK